MLQGTRVDYFRGKDFVRLAKASPESFRAALLPSQRPPAEADAEDLAGAVGRALLARRLVLRCDRASRKPIPGTNGKLVKFPKRLVLAGAPGAGGAVSAPSPSPSFATKDAFYALAFESPSSVGWTVFVAVAVAAAVIGVCLFPLAPNGVKLAAFNVSLGLLLAIVGVVVLRALLALATWILLGRALWFLPLLLDDAKPLAEVFAPLWAWEETENPDHWSRKPPVRLLVALSIAGGLRQLARKAPAGRAVVANAMRYRDEVLEFLSVDVKRINDGEQEPEGAHQHAASESAGEEGEEGRSHEDGLEDLEHDEEREDDDEDGE